MDLINNKNMKKVFPKYFKKNKNEFIDLDFF